MLILSRLARVPNCKHNAVRGLVLRAKDNGSLCSTETRLFFYTPLYIVIPCVVSNTTRVVYVAQQSRRNPTRKRTVSMFWLHAPAHAQASSASPRMYF